MKNISKFILTLLIITFTSVNSRAQGVVPVYIHDFEGHSIYTDQNIINLICQLNNIYEIGGPCSPSGIGTGIRFALQGVIRHPAPTGGSGLSPNTFMLSTGASKIIGGSLNIFLYDFGSTSGVGVYLGGSAGYDNVIMLKITGFNKETFAHEVGHYLGLGHISDIHSPLETYYTVATCIEPNDLTTSTVPSNYMISSTSPSCCFFSDNQIEIMKCHYLARTSGGLATRTYWASLYPALLYSGSYVPPLISIKNSGPDVYYADVIRPTSCSFYHDGYMIYSIKYCGEDPNVTSPSDVNNAYTTGSYIPILPCAVGILICTTYHGGLVNITRTKFDTRHSGCSPTTDPIECQLHPIEYMKKSENELETLSEEKTEIYPTICKSEINIKGVKDYTTIIVTDMIGRLIIQTSISNKVEVGNLMPGNYVIKLTGQNKVFTSRFTKL